MPMSEAFKPKVHKIDKTLRSCMDAHALAQACWQYAALRTSRLASIAMARPIMMCYLLSNLGIFGCKRDQEFANVMRSTFQEKLYIFATIT